jgi:hypothetical protein
LKEQLCEKIGVPATDENVEKIDLYESVTRVPLLTETRDER